jgi:hypothetical protein
MPDQDDQQNDDLFWDEGSYDPYWYLPDYSAAGSDATYVEYMDQDLVIAGNEDRTDLEDNEGYRLPHQSGAEKVLTAALAKPSTAISAGIGIIILLLFIKKGF